MLLPSGLFYDIQENDIRVEMAFREASKLQKARLAKEKPPPPPPDGAEAGGRRLGSPTASLPSATAYGEEQGKPGHDPREVGSEHADILCVSGVGGHWQRPLGHVWVLPGGA